ncbi:MAG: isochorismate synthase [Bacteroidetes bacterium QS_8_68_15]|nr:MAG: isochorismate synthase [Bacteroidetes bacterium QS_8_68_15]
MPAGSTPRRADPAADRSDGLRGAGRVLARAVRRRSPEEEGARQGFRRVEVGVSDADLIGWLRAQPAPRGFWKDRGGEARAFAGVADRFETPAHLDERLQNEPSSDDEAASGPDALRCYGGVRFDRARAAADGWQHFGPGAFVLPRFELRRVRDGSDDDDGEARLACHLAPGEKAGPVAAEIEQLAPPAPSSSADPALPRPTRRDDHPGRSAWEERVEAALRAIDEGTVQKVVLARRTTFRFEQSLDPVPVLERLRALAPGGFAFLFQPRRAGAFLGVSPERLFRQRGRRVWSEAVAGTRPRASAPDADDALRRELLESDKDRREHAFVQRYVREALDPLCTSLDERDAAALTLQRGRHLYARFRGQLRDGVSPADVLGALHPTPAVSGRPSAAAQRFIRRREPFDRGWYAAPVGWVGRGEGGAPAAELAVGIRSGLVRRPNDGDDDRLDLFAGAGLVDGSEPEAEWNELEQKLGNFTALFRDP